MQFHYLAFRLTIWPGVVCGKNQDLAPKSQEKRIGCPKSPSFPFLDITWMSKRPDWSFLLLRKTLYEYSMRYPDACSKGFTLLELLVVMVIIGLLAAYVGPRYFNQLSKSEVKTAKAQLVALGKALDAYRLDTGHYPSTAQGLDALNKAPGDEPKWSGPYLQKAVPPDPWGHPYIYRMPGSKNEFDLLSYGKDGQPGGDGDAADLSYFD